MLDDDDSSLTQKQTERKTKNDTVERHIRKTEVSVKEGSTRRPDYDRWRRFRSSRLRNRRILETNRPAVESNRGRVSKCDRCGWVVGFDLHCNEKKIKRLETHR